MSHHFCAQLQQSLACARVRLATTPTLATELARCVAAITGLCISFPLGGTCSLTVTFSDPVCRDLFVTLAPASITGVTAKGMMLGTVTTSMTAAAGTSSLTTTPDPTTCAALAPMAPLTTGISAMISLGGLPPVPLTSTLTIMPTGATCPIT